MQEPITSSQTRFVIDFSVESPASGKIQIETFSASPEDLDLQSAAELLRAAELHFDQRDFKTTAKLIEQALPAIDRLYSRHDIGRLKALKILRDAYLALSKGVEAKDCAEVGLAFFEDIIKSKVLTQENLTIEDPSAFARPVVRKLKTLRRSRDSEFLKKRSIDISEKWRIFCKTTTSGLVVI
jgi:DNA-binding transcriptional MerR regulator